MPHHAPLQPSDVACIAEARIRQACLLFHLWKGVRLSLFLIFFLQSSIASLPARADTPVGLGHTVPAGPGKVVPAGPGKTVPAGPGKVVAVGPEKGPWRTFQKENGIVDTDVLRFLQDRDGYLWIGTASGVSRYDGQSFVNFTTQDGLADHAVVAICQDGEGALWFGTYAGASRFDPKAADGKAWTTFTTEDGLAGNNVQAIIADRAGNLWFGIRGGGVSRYGPSENLGEGEKQFTNFTTRDGLALDRVWCAVEDQDGNLWFGTDGGGVSRFDGTTFKTFTTEDGLGSNTVYSSFLDQEGHPWFATIGGGASRFNGENFQTVTTREGLADNGVSTISQDREGRIWIGTKYRGASRYDPRAGHDGVEGLRADPSTLSERSEGRFTQVTAKDGLVSNSLEKIFQDRDGYLWFGATGGANQYDPRTLITIIGADGLERHVLAGFQDREGNLWFGATDGVSRYDGATFTTFTTRDGLAGNTVRAITQDREGNLWFGSGIGGSVGEGVTLYRPEKGTFTTFTTQDGLGSNNVESILQDREGILWFGSFGGGVSRYDGKTFTIFTTEDGLASNLVGAMLQDRDGHLWFGSGGMGGPGAGVSRYDGETFIVMTEKDGLASNVVSSLFEDQEGNLWFAGKGVSRYDGTSLTTFTARDGFPNRTLSICQDRHGVLYFGTNDGVIRYDGQVFQTITDRDGLADNTVQSVLQDREGSLWFGTVGGITRFRPPSPTSPVVFIDAVVADRRYEGIDALEIPTTSSLISVEFRAAMNFHTRPEAMVYRYRLSGFDNDWQNTHARRVEYQDLPVGTYTFEVQAVDRDLSYSVPVQLSIDVHLPYQQLALAVGLVIALSLVGWQTVRVLQRDRRLRVANNALSDANNELFGLNKDLQLANTEIQTQTERKSAFLASMSHELRTPMNAIKGFTSLVIRRSGDALPDQQRENLVKVDRASDRLLAMINDLLDLSKIEAGRMDVNVETFDVARMVQDGCDTVSPLVQEGVELRQGIADNVGKANTDKARILQMVINLLSNAIKFTDSGSVTVKAERENGGGGSGGENLVISVTDTGKGIPADELPTLFDEYRQVEGQSASDVQEGTGLGLSITKKFAELLGGSIEVESEPGKGSTFTVRVPVKYAE
jgi:signal transduction histidine kinase/ligand-binding sensor domain-containing protein